eukprot:RCo049604
MAASSSEAPSVGDTRIKVILRVRPPNKQERDWFAKKEFNRILRDVSRTENPDQRIIIDHSNKSYDYDKVFHEDASQKQLFREAAIPTLENVFKGYCGAVMAYGQTGTGKTHTMQGYDKSLEGDDRGIIPRCAEYIFTRILKETAYNCKVSLMFVQIYLDKLQDLFKPEAPEVSINPETERVELPGITEKEVTSMEQFMELFYYGEKHRVTRATLMNPTSSRGHAALVVNLKMIPNDSEGLMSKKFGKLVLVDLAGYERFSATGITTGIAAEEAKKINASLLALGSVVNALAEKQSHIPYRNAKLTRLLKDCLGGTSKSTIVLTMGPCDRYKQESAGTLFFGWRAMAVKVSAKIKEEYDPARYIQNLKDKVNDAQEMIRNLVRWLKAGGNWAAYVVKYGEPKIPEMPEDNEDQEEIIAALTRQPSGRVGRIGTMARVKREQNNEGEVESLIGRSPEAILGPGCEEKMINGDVPQEVQNVVRTWNLEMRAQAEAASRELELLRLRHLQDLEEAKQAGVSDEVLVRLREEHEWELRLMQEQNQLLREELLKQREREEAAALLTSATKAIAKEELATAKAGGGGGGAKVEDPAMGEKQKDDARINEMVTHLQETCQNKDEVLIRLFDLINLREAEIRDYEMNQQAITIAHVDDSLEILKMLRKENQGLKGALAARDTEIARLRMSCSAGAGSTTAQHPASACNSPPPPPRSEERRVGK